MLIIILLVLNYLNFFENEGFKVWDDEEEDVCDQTSQIMCDFKLKEDEKNHAKHQGPSTTIWKALNQTK